MNINEFLYKRDETKVKVIAGDLAHEIWELEGTRLSLLGLSTAEGTGSIDLASEIKELALKDQISQDSVEPLVGAGVGMLLGAQMGRIVGLGARLGAVGGAVAGHFLTKHVPEVSVSCELKDGRKFLAVMQPQTFERIKVIASIGAKTAG